MTNMICLRCGYCCYNSDVIILDKNNDFNETDIKKYNLSHKPNNNFCIHQTFDLTTKQSICKIHHLKIYKETPCFQYTQIGEGECRMGNYIKNDIFLKYLEFLKK